MEFVWEILLTVVLSMLLAFLIVEFCSTDSRGDEEVESESRSEKVSGKVDESDAEVVREERILRDELRNRGLESERRVEFVGEAVKIDEFHGESADGGEEDLESIEAAIGVKDLFKEKSSEISVVGLEEQSQSMEEKSDEEVKSSESISEGVLEVKSMDERTENLEFNEIGLKLAEEDEVIDDKDAKDEHIDVVENTEEKSSEIGAKGAETGEEEGLLGDDDDWEGIERSGVEKRFDAAARFAGSDDHSDRLSKLGSDLKMQLYGLRKVAIEGPCYEPPPMALMVSARAKWNAWQKLGNLSPEVAMEQYISILSEGIPGWEGEKSDRDCNRDKSNDSPDTGESGTKAHGEHPRITEVQSTHEGLDDAIKGVKNP